MSNMEAELLVTHVTRVSTVLGLFSLPVHTVALPRNMRATGQMHAHIWEAELGNGVGDKCCSLSWRRKDGRAGHRKQVVDEWFTDGDLDL